MDVTTSPGLPADIALSGAPAVARNFEFDETQNGVFRDLSRNMGFVGIIYLVLGVILVFFGIVGIVSEDFSKAAGPLLQAAFILPLALWTRRAATATAAVAETRGNDIGHLMTAMQELKLVYGLQRALLILLFGVLAILILIGAIAGLTAAHT